MSQTVQLDTSVSVAGSGATIAGSLTTSGANRLAVLFVYCNAATVSSITGGGTWTRRNQTPGQELWTCPLMGQKNSVTVTVTLSSSQSATALVLDTFNIADASAIPTFDAAGEVSFSTTTTPTGTVTTVANNVTVASYAEGAGTPTGSIAAGAGYTLTSSVSFAAGGFVGGELKNADTGSPATVTPGFTFGNSSSGKITTISMLGQPISTPPVAPTGVTATYTAGVGITVAWSAPAGYIGTGYNVYRVRNSQVNGNGIRAQDAAPFVQVPWGTNSFVDREQGYPPVSTGDNVCAYYVTTVNAGAESAASTVSSTATFVG